MDSINQRRCFEVSTASGPDYLLLDTICKDGVYDVIVSENEIVSCSGASDSFSVKAPPNGMLHVRTVLARSVIHLYECYGVSNMSLCSSVYPGT